jgi:hypothetical protein
MRGCVTVQTLKGLNMNKVTKDLMKWFPVLSENNAMVVHTQLMYDGIDFSEISNKELKAEAKRVIDKLYGEVK